MGDVKEKIRAIENFDRLIVGPIAEGISHSEPHRVMVLPDHFTPITLGTHAADPVPFLVCGTGVPGGGAAGFSEAEARRAGIVVEQGFELLPAYLRK